MHTLKNILFIFLFCSGSLFAQEDIRIPNIFSPNNDGANDTFVIRSSGYEGLSCTIVNRYGETIYRFFGLNGTWDGYTHAGVKVSPGTYFVYVEATRDDGSSETRQGTLQVTY